MSGTPVHRCEKCRLIFMADPLLQAELKHIAAKEGTGAAEFELSERLGEEHANH